MGISFYPNLCEHSYSLATVGLKKNTTKVFRSRGAANEYMYNVLAKNHLAIRKVYDDKHDKTYKCGDGIAFYIQRM